MTTRSPYVLSLAGLFALAGAPAWAQPEPAKTPVVDATQQDAPVAFRFYGVQGAGIRKATLNDGLQTAGDGYVQAGDVRLRLTDGEQATLVRNADGKVTGAQAGLRMRARITVPANADGSAPTQEQVRAYLEQTRQDVVSTGAEAQVYGTTQGAGGSLGGDATIGAPITTTASGKKKVKINLGLFIVKLVPSGEVTQGGIGAKANVAFDVEWRGKVAFEIGAGLNVGRGVAGKLRVEIMINPQLDDALLAAYRFARDKVIKPVMAAAKRGINKVGDGFKGRKGPSRESGEPTATFTPAGKAPNTDLTDAEAAARYAPVIYQQVTPKTGKRSRQLNDTLRRVDFDGDWDTRNNWDNVPQADADAKGYVYYDVKQTKSHYFVTYLFYYPGRNGKWSSWHENDIAGVQVVAKKGAPRFAEVEIVMTTKGNRMTNYVSPSAQDWKPIRYAAKNDRSHTFTASRNPGVSFVDETTHPQFDRHQTHAQLFVTDGKHNVYAYNGRDDRFGDQAFSGKPGVVYYPGGPHVAPNFPNSAVGYALRPASELNNVTTTKKGKLQGDGGTIAHNGASLPIRWWNGMYGFPRGAVWTNPADLVSKMWETPADFSKRYVVGPKATGMTGTLTQQQAAE